MRARYAGRHVVDRRERPLGVDRAGRVRRPGRAGADTRITWLLRRGAVGVDVRRRRGGPAARAWRARAAGQGRRSTQGRIAVVTGFRTETVEARDGDGSTLVSDGGQRVSDVDEVVVLTGFRPDLSWLSELRLELDATLQAPVALAPLIDPNVHSCGTVYPHGVKELAHPEPDVYLAGHEELRPRADVPRDDRLRAGPLHRRRARRRPRGRRAGRAGAARDRSLRRRRCVRHEPAEDQDGGCCGAPAEPADADPVGAASAR